MAKQTTVPAILQPLMGKPSLKLPHCAVCGRLRPLNQHHIVRRSAGRMFDGAGHELKAPTITLCGFGNHLRDADGSPFCHGLAHAGRLHFRWVQEPGFAGAGHWEFLMLGDPASYMDALEMRGWRPC